MEQQLTGPMDLHDLGGQHSAATPTTGAWRSGVIFLGFDLNSGEQLLEFRLPLSK